MTLDLRTGFGDYEQYKLFKFPDNSIKFILEDKVMDYEPEHICIRYTLRNSDDLIALGLIKQTIDTIFTRIDISLHLSYLMYQQDDRIFNTDESFGLKFICNYINSLKFDFIYLFHPHSDVSSALLNYCEVKTNKYFIQDCIENIDNKNAIWVIPDSGAFKNQFKYIQELEYPNFITCMKSRDHSTESITTVVNCNDLEGRDCFIIDDIVLGGQTFINIATELKKKNCGKLYLIVSHGIFNKGIEHLVEYFDIIYTTDSICTLKESDKLKIYKL